MKIKISNLGIIKNAEIELKPLTLFVGDNGTGKTWAAYTIAALFGDYGYEKYLEAYLDDKTNFKFKVLEEKIQTLLDEGTVTVNFEQFLIDHAEKFINEIATLLPQYLYTFMATKRVSFENTNISVEFIADSIDKLVEISKHFKITAASSIGKIDASSSLSVNALKKKDSGELYFYTTSENKDNFPNEIKKTEIKKFVTTVLFRAIHKCIFTNTPIFPTERTTFITLPLPYRPKRTKSIKNKKSHSAGENNSIPVRHFLEMVTSSIGRFFERKKERQDESKINNFIKLSDFLQNEILLGNIDFEEHLGSLEILYSPEKNTNLELNISSSMVKELASLSLYLKYVANPNDLVVIDEPEMNLHPAAQVEIAEFMGMLVNSDLNLLITTHSPYIVDHIANLMRAFDCKDKNNIKQHFYLEQESSFISKDKVAIYLFEDGKVKSLISEDGDVDWSTFSDISRSLSGIYKELLNG